MNELNANAVILIIFLVCAIFALSAWFLIPLGLVVVYMPIYDWLDKYLP